jgi:hypothetical protein
MLKKRIRLRHVRSTIAGMVLVVVGGCSHTPSEPAAVPTPPIVLTGSLFADPLSGGGNLLLTDVCGCVSVPLTVVSNARPPEPLACHETHPLDYSSSTVVVTVSAPTWSVSGTYSVPFDPHVGLRVHADCRSN